MKFKIDENLPVEAADILVLSGHDAVTVHNQQLAGAADSEVISVCDLGKRVLITLDTHFADAREYPPADFNGLVVLRHKRQDKPHIYSTSSADSRRFFPLSRLRAVYGLLKRLESEFENRARQVFPGFFQYRLIHRQVHTLIRRHGS